MKDMRIGVVGGGVVGKATARSYLEHVKEVRVYDVVKERGTHPLAEVMNSDLVFVCLPTPRVKIGFKSDLTALREFFRGEFGSDSYLVLKSTVPIGTTNGFREEFGLKNLVHSPEFLTARCSLVDAQVPSRNIIGQPNYARGEDGDRTVSEGAILLRQLYTQRFPCTPIFTMSSDESEAVKLFLNGFFAVKVAFWNEMRTLADHYELDWDAVMEGVLSDGRIHPSHTMVPGPDGLRGFGGECLPKDLANLVGHFSSSGVTGPVVRAAMDRNERIDRKR